MTALDMDLMLELQSTGFALLEIQLYLDIHPYDSNALLDYSILTKRMKTLRKAYEQQVGPIIGYGEEHTSHRTGWVEQPWPWESH